MIVNHYTLDQAIAAHGNQKWGNYPYALHLQAVMKFAMRIQPSEVLGKTAYLHDILEDTRTSPKDLPEDVRDNVILLSRNYDSMGRKMGRPTPYNNYINRIAESGNDVVILVKFADSVMNFELCGGFHTLQYNVPNLSLLDKVQTLPGVNRSLAERYKRNIEVLSPLLFNGMSPMWLLFSNRAHQALSHLTRGMWDEDRREILNLM